MPLFPHLAKQPKDFTCSLEDIGVALNGVPIRSITTGVKNGTVGTPSRCIPPVRKLTKYQTDTQNAGVDWTFSVYGVGEVKTCDFIGEDDGVLECGDVVPYEGIYYDKCGGRADDDGLYHYKVAPTCLVAQLDAQRGEQTVFSHSPGDEDTAFAAISSAARTIDLGQHSPQIGWAMDGFPIYGPRGPKGTLMAPCTATSMVSPIHGKLEAARPSVQTSLNYSQNDYGAGFLNRGAMCLDRCNGLYAELPKVDNFIYRYYMTGEDTSGECSSVVANSGQCSSIQDKECCISRVPSKNYAPYGPACLVGCELGVDCEKSGISGTTGLFYPTVSPYPTEVYEANEQQTTEIVVESDAVDVSVETSVSMHDAHNDVLYHEMAVQKAMLTNAGGKEKTLFRFFHNRSLAILTTDTKDPLMGNVDPETKSLISDSSVLVSTDNTTKTTTTVPTNNTFTSDTIQVELLPVSSRDAFINDMALHRNESTFFLSLPTTIASVPKDGKGKEKKMTIVVHSLVYLTIEGHDLGSKAEDVLSVQLGAYFSSTVRWVSSSLVKAVFTNIPYVDLTINTYPTFTAQDVKIVTKGGEMVGPHLQPLTLIKSRSGRPVIIQVDIVTKGLAPYAIATPTAGVGMSGPAINERVYWSNMYQGVSGLLRCKQDGSLVETLVTKKERIYDILVLPLEFSDAKIRKDVVLYVDAQLGELMCVTAPSETALSYTADSTEKAAVEMPLLGDNVEFSVLTGMLEPAALALDDTGGFVYVVTRNGLLYEMKLNSLIDLVSSKVDETIFDGTARYGGGMIGSAGVDVRMGKLPKWIRYIDTGILSVMRITGISILPTVNSMLPSDSSCPSDYEIEPWYRRRIVLSNAARSSVILISTSGLRPVELYVGGNSGDKQIIWPMNVIARYELPSLHSYLGIVCNNFKAPFSTFQVKLYLAEFLGKIWEQELNLPVPRSFVNDTWNLDIVRALRENSTLWDASQFTASLEIRSYFEYSRRFDPVTTFVEVELSQPIPVSMKGVGTSPGGRVLNRESPIRFEAVG